MRQFWDTRYLFICSNGEFSSEYPYSKGMNKQLILIDNLIHTLKIPETVVFLSL
jgi:hypothetical protein